MVDDSVGMVDALKAEPRYGRRRFCKKYLVESRLLVLGSSAYTAWKHVQAVMLCKSVERVMTLVH
jgi:hypothetical protein